MTRFTSNEAMTNLQKRFTKFDGMRRREMKRLTVTLILFFVFFMLTETVSADPPWIFGMHDPGGESEMVAKGKRGWIVFTEAVGHNPNDWSGRDYRQWSDAGHGVIVRLNNGYGGSGTLPYESDYGDFAIRCGNFVEASQGARIWIIGNETNLPREWPGNINGDPNTGQPITVQRYVNAYQQCRDEIKSRSGHGNDIVCPAPTGTYGPPYPAQGVEGFLDYWVNILNTLGPDQVDGLPIHAYTHGSDPTLIFSDVKMGPPYSDIYYHFRVYRNYMDAIPAGMRDKPVWITESDQSREVSGYNWDPRVTNWIQNAYFEINQWNSNAWNQKIRGLVLFRWEEAWEGDRSYCIPCISATLQDWRAAMDNDYRWTESQESQRGQPRVQYRREYWVVDSRATLSQLQQIVAMAYPNRITVGFSYDDAGLGDLDERYVTVWGDEYDRNVLLDWFQQYYGGVTVEFRALPGEGSWHYGPYTTTEPSSGRGQPRVQYGREYWVIDSGASLEHVHAIAEQNYDQRKTMGFSYDDAGIGDLDQRHVVVWGNEFPEDVLIDWYDQYYFGVTLEFRPMPSSALTDFASVTIGEVGHLDDTLTHTPKTVFLDHPYQNPVVFAQPLSRDGGNTAVVRIVDVQSDRFTLYVHESPDMDGKHTTEAVSYLVLEAGTWQLASGARLEVGTVNTAATVGRGLTNVWEQIDFETAFSAEPVVLSQVQTANDPHWVKTRQRKAGPGGFEVALEQEENKPTPHGSETIGWLAMEAGTGSWNGHVYEAGQTADAVTHRWHTITFDAPFGKVPCFQAGLATYDGGDSAHLRYNRSSLAASGVEVTVEEDRAGDEEMDHTTEKVNYLAIEMGGSGWAYPIGDAFSGDGWWVSNPLGNSWYSQQNQRWYRGHLGEDWFKNEGSSLGEPVYATAAGTVITVLHNCGNYVDVVIIEHQVKGLDEPIYSFYGHLKADGYVQEGDWVEMRQQIGILGDPRPHFLPHLHFEIKNHRALINPPFSGCSDIGNAVYISTGYSGISDDYDGGDYYDPSDSITGNRYYHPSRFIENHR
jgi:murein DD-endopeptidase MepM/ murein hydrolase activator NlpD